MKTKSYLRLSLLIPFLVWVICLVIFIVWSKLFPNSPGVDGSEGMINIVLLPLLFYVFGIIGWLLPYLMLALILFLWSFRSRSQVLMKMFALSPLVMTILVLILVNVLSIGNGGWSLFSPNPTTNAPDILGSNALFAVLTLLWGYICVGIGYGIYKILQRQGFIKEEVVITPAPLNQTS
jgi:hypothetical protein